VAWPVFAFSYAEAGRGHKGITEIEGMLKALIKSLEKNA